VIHRPLFWRYSGTEPPLSDRPGEFLRITLPLPAMRGNATLDIHFGRLDDLRRGGCA